VPLASTYQSGLRGQTGERNFPRDAKALTDVVVQVLRARVQSGTDAKPKPVGVCWGCGGGHGGTLGCHGVIPLIFNAFVNAATALKQCVLTLPC
jgi:hypothetical protein